MRLSKSPLAFFLLAIALTQMARGGFLFAVPVATALGWALTAIKGGAQSPPDGFRGPPKNGHY